MNAGRRIGRALAVVALAAAMFMPPPVTGAVLGNISGLVPKNGSWAYYNTIRCTTDPTDVPLLWVTAWAGNNADMFFFIRSSQTGLAIGNFTPENPLRVILHQPAPWREFGDFVEGTCFKMTARKDGFPFAWGSETWTADLFW